MTDIVPPDDRISAYLDGALSATEHYEVQQLLVASPEWRKELDEVSSARVTVRAMPARVAPTGFFESLLRDGLEELELRKESKAQPKRMRGRSARSTRRARPEGEPADDEEYVEAEDYVDAPPVPDHLRTDLPHTIEEMPFAAASPPASAPPAPVVDDLYDQSSRAPYHDPYDDLYDDLYDESDVDDAVLADEPAVAASPPVAAGPPPPPGDPDVVAPTVAFRSQVESPSALPPTPQPTPDDPFEQLLPEGPLSWDRPVAPPAPAPAPRPRRTASRHRGRQGRRALAATGPARAGRRHHPVGQARPEATAAARRGCAGAGGGRGPRERAGTRGRARADLARTRRARCAHGARCVGWPAPPRLRPW